MVDKALFRSETVVLALSLAFYESLALNILITWCNSVTTYFTELDQTAVNCYLDFCSL